MNTTLQTAGRPVRAWRRVLVAWAGGLLVALAAAQADGPSSYVVDEAKAAALKAAYLRYLAEFAVWPEAALAAPEVAIVIGIVGADPHGVGETLEKAIRDGSLPRAQEHPLLLRRYPAVPDRPDKAAPGSDGSRPPFAAWVKECHLVFVTRAEQARWPVARRAVAGLPVLTVSELPAFAEAGGMVELALSPATGRIGLRINLGELDAAGLRLSSRLLGLKQGVELLGLPAEGDGPRRPNGGER